MRLVYPPDNHQTFENSTFFIGSVAPGAVLTLNDQTAITVSRKGFFAWRVLLQPGENRFQFMEQSPTGDTDTVTRTIIQVPPLKLDSLPQKTDELLPFIFPSEDIGVSPGESIILFCATPKGSKVWCRIDWLMSRPVEMTPTGTRPDNRDGIFGQLHQVSQPWPEGDFYMAHVHIPANTPPLPNLIVQYSMQQDDRRVEVRSTGTITILPLGKRPWATVTSPEAVTRTHLTKGARRTPLLAGTVMEISGFWGTSFKARYGPNDVAWVQSEDIQLQEQTVYPPVVPVHLIQTNVGPRSFQVVIPLRNLMPMDVVLESSRVILKLFGAQSFCDFIHYQHGAIQQGLQQIAWRQVNPEVLEVEIALSSSLHGFQRYYDDQQKALVCTLRTAKSLENFPFTVAVDPGHGGEETGATAPDGTPEKDLNMKLALKIQQILKKAPQVKVVLTRTQDETVPLAERVKRAISAEANLLLSLHHNALPDGRNPLEENGVSAYYYYPFAMPFAQRFQDALVKQTGFADYGILFDSLHMCRIMEMPAILLELGFLTHPEDAALCLDEDHQTKVAHAISSVITSCVKIPNI